MYIDYLNSGINPADAFSSLKLTGTGQSPFRPEYEEYIERYPGRGTLKVQISVAKEAFPLKNVVVDVSQIYNGVRYSLYNDVTDISGIVDNMVLPAKTLESTLNFDTAGVDEAQYLVSVYHPDFEAVSDCCITIQDKIETILPISLVPRTTREEQD
ncbi:MAG: hypothetical protein IJH32_08080 [Ruminococcus sp.]|nr:hypothetical protein [Ruminococcus sp.]